MRENHYRRRVHELAKPATAHAVRLLVMSTHETPRAQVYGVRVY